MAGKNDASAQNRRDAMYWAEEWKIKQRKKRRLIILAAIVITIVVIYLINYASILGSRSIYSSEAEMREAVQGRYVSGKYEEIVVKGDKISLTYYSPSHYDKEFAEEYGYDEYGDSTYEDTVEKWDYRKGVIKCGWMDDIIVDKSGQLEYYHQKFTYTEEPAPVPFDPSTLSNYHDEDGENTDDECFGTDGIAADRGALPEDEEDAFDAYMDSLEDTQDAAEEAGVLPETDEV